MTHGFERQQRHNGGSGKGVIATDLAVFVLVLPGADALGVEPDRQAATVDERLIVGFPVADVVADFG